MKTQAAGVGENGKVLTAFAIVDGAVEFEGLEASASLEGADSGKAKRPGFSIQAYNGGLLNLSWWGPTIIDLEGLRAGAVAVLLDHDSRQIVGTGQAKKTQRAVNVRGSVTGDYESKGDPAEVVVSQARNGFPWQASVGVSVERYETVEAGAEVAVNGRKWQGPIEVIRQGRLGEVSFVAVGADENSSAMVAARAAGIGGDDGGDTEMGDEDKKVTGEGALQAPQDGKEAEVKTDKSKVQASAPAQPDGGGSAVATAAADGMQAMRAAAAQEIERIAAIRALFGEQHLELCSQMITDGSTVVEAKAAYFEAENKRIRASRAEAPNVASGQPAAMSPQVLEAAVLMGAGKQIEAKYPEQVLEAAHKRFRYGLGAGKLLCVMAELATGRRFDLSQDGVPTVVQAAMSNADVAEILSNVANKYLEIGYSYGENADLRIARTVAVRDYKQKTSYRLQANGKFEKVGADGALQYGTLSDQSFTNQADIYGIVFGLDKKSLVNDDLGAFDTLQTVIGQGAALSRQEVFWTEFLANADDDSNDFFSSDNSNVASGAGSALSISAITAAILLLRKMVDGKSQPINVQPWELLVPAALEGTALEIYRSLEMRSASGTKVPTTNIYQGRFEPIVSRYLDDTGLTGYSAKAWYLLADPLMVPVIELCFLNGQQTPMIESVAPTVDYLGIQMRGTLSFGVNLQDPRGGVRSAGE